MADPGAGGPIPLACRISAGTAAPTELCHLPVASSEPDAAEGRGALLGSTRRSSSSAGGAGSPSPNNNATLAGEMLGSLTLGAHRGPPPRRP